MRSGAERQVRRARGDNAGLGLGFFIAKTLLERSGAELTLANRRAPSEGAVVRIVWQRAAFETAVAWTARPPSPAGASEQNAILALGKKVG
jgi:two-component system sensor histidine kinase RegB